MNNLTEQQKEDLFKDAPEGYNYYTPESENWYKSWFIVKDGTAIKTMLIEYRIEHSCSYDIEDLLAYGAIKRPRAKGRNKKGNEND